ncbi:hypothetical protein ACFY4C_24960 [Actinomadura viridis]|uniref:hypothetical protein n=1 Tax=Actinomadura viridis TaxID=58110 RepID=UPI0036C058CF
MRNTGGRALVISGSLSLSDGPGGLRAGPYPADLGVTLLPGGRAPVTVALDQRLPNGPWKARLTLRSGMVERKVSATLTFPASGTGDPVTPASATWLYALLAVAAAVLLAGPAFLLRRRRVLAAARG